MTTQKNPIPNMIAGTQGVPVVDFACHEGWQIVRDSGGKRTPGPMIGTPACLSLRTAMHNEAVMQVRQRQSELLDDMRKPRNRGLP
jgi:hypothetical protein